MGAISEFLTFKAGAPEVGLVPGIGGSPSALRWRGIDLMCRRRHVLASGTVH
jgi:hypothetical protein